jgi:hypothetical protein
MWWEKVPDTPKPRSMMKGWVYEVAENADYSAGNPDHDDRQSIEALVGREQDPQFSEYAPPTLLSDQGCSLEKLRSAVADLLYAVSSAFQDKQEEAYRYVSRAAALRRDTLIRAANFCAVQTGASEICFSIIPSVAEMGP